MRIAVLTIKLYAPWVHSLKEKRMIVKSLTIKVRNQFNVSVAEVSDQDIHQTIVIAVASVAADSAQADSIMEHVLDFVERNTDAQVTDVTRETR